MAARLPHETIDLTEAEAGPLAHDLGREKRIEHLAEHIGRNSRAVVRHRHENVLPRSECVLASIFPVYRGVAGFYRQPAALWHGIARIDREIDHGAFELGRVCLDPPEAIRQHRIEAD